MLIAEEAGAYLCDLNGKPVDFLTKEIVVGNKQLVDEFIVTA
jgi:fructose-1,6-bisphosphatase/inositol monophosphatase family enzyme